MDVLLCFEPWQDGRVQEQERPWESMELGKHEEALAPSRLGAVRRAAALKKSTTGVGVDHFHPRVPLDLSDECCGRILHKVRVRPTNASTTFFLLGA